MKAYLLVNAALYAIFALWCSLKATDTANNLGYVGLNNSGRSEYLVIYGGLQAGLAIMFFLMARDVSFHKLGMLVSIGIYAPIVLYRLATIWKFSPVSTLTMSVGALETTLLIAALWISFRTGAFRLT
jgi:hypothetical protein